MFQHMKRIQIHPWTAISEVIFSILLYKKIFYINRSQRQKGG